MTEDILFWMAVIRTVAVIAVMVGSFIYWYYRLNRDKKEGRKT